MSVNMYLIYRCLSSTSAVTAFVVYLRTIKVHNDSVFKELTVHFLLQKSHLWNPPCRRISKRKYLPMPSEFHNREPPSSSEIRKAVHGIGMDIFWNCPIFPYLPTLLVFPGVSKFFIKYPDLSECLLRGGLFRGLFLDIVFMTFSQCKDF